MASLERRKSLLANGLCYNPDQFAEGLQSIILMKFKIPFLFRGLFVFATVLFLSAGLVSLGQTRKETPKEKVPKGQANDQAPKAQAPKAIDPKTRPPSRFAEGVLRLPATVLAAPSWLKFAATESSAAGCLAFCRMGAPRKRATSCALFAATNRRKTSFH